MGRRVVRSGSRGRHGRTGPLRACCRLQSGRQRTSSGRPRAACESDACLTCCTRCRHDDCATATGWPGKRLLIAPLAVPLARPYRAVRPCRSAGTLSARGSPNRCSLAPRAPMHACSQAELAGRTPSAQPDGRIGRLRARAQAYCPAVWESRWPRLARAHFGHWHTLAVGALAQLHRSAGRRSARGACGGGQHGAAHPCAPAAAARIWCTPCVFPQA